MIGETISHYRILQKLGEGGMGVVYKAEDTKLHRTVALKFLPPDRLSSKIDSARFAREAQAAARLNHPNIATIFEFDEVEDSTSHTTEAFIAMEYVEGTTLQEIIKRGPLRLDLVTSIALQLATALLTAHKKNIVHRDLKPGNIVITPEGVVKILDFGLAKMAGAARTTRDGMMAGTVSYMSPEQLQGTEIDYRSDIWSFGVTVYEMLTGKLPFRGEFEPAIMYNILNEPPESVSSIRPDVPKEFVELIDKCLQKNPSSRAQSMAQLMRILDKKIVVSTGFNFRHPRIARRIVTALPGIAIGAVLAWYVISNFVDTTPSTLTLAIMRFRNETNDSLAASWPIQVQRYLSAQITGTEDIAVMYDDHLNDLVRGAFGTSDPPSDSRLSAFLREDVNYFVSGTIYRHEASFAIQATIVKTGDGNQLQSFRADVAGGEQLGPAVGRLAEQILAFLFTEVLQSENNDLAVWKQRPPRDWKAVEAFSQANELIMNDQDPALKLARAVELDSNFLSPRIWMFPALVRQKKLDETNRHHEFLLRMKPSANSFESAMIDWVGAFRAGDYAQQAHYLRVALRSSKDNRILLHNLAYAESMRGNYRDAVQALEPCLRTKWQYAPMYRVAGESLLKLGDIDAARKLLNDALSSDWVDPRVYAMLAAVYKRDMDRVNAARFEQLALKAYRERNRPFGLAYERIAVYLNDIGMLDSAEAVIRRALEDDANIGSYHGQLAEILFRHGDVTDAQAESHIALKLDSSFIQSHFLLGKILEQEGDQPGAIKQYVEFLKHDSTSVDAQFTRQRVRVLQR